jgi:hypothetical protein
MTHSGKTFTVKNVCLHKNTNNAIGYGNKEKVKLLFFFNYYFFLPQLFYFYLIGRIPQSCVP